MLMQVFVDRITVSALRLYLFSPIEKWRRSSSMHGHSGAKIVLICLLCVVKCFFLQGLWTPPDTRSGSLCVYINTECCKNSILVSSYCSSLKEFVTVCCRPFYLPWEFTILFIIRVYIPPRATAKEALFELYAKISEPENTHPVGCLLSLEIQIMQIKTVDAKFHKYVDLATKVENMLHLVYTNIPGAFRAETRTHLSYSDYISAYRFKQFQHTDHFSGIRNQF